MRLITEDESTSPTRPRRRRLKYISVLLILSSHDCSSPAAPSFPDAGEDGISIVSWRLALSLLNRSSSSSVNSEGSFTLTVAKRSPRCSTSLRGLLAELFNAGIPCPANRNRRPFWVPWGMVNASRPEMVGTVNSPPRTASSKGTSFSQRKLTSKYQTTTRKVSKTFEMRSDGRLLVTVKLNPNQGKTIVHKRVFDRRH